jgi:hypothetical protein
VELVKGGTPLDELGGRMTVSYRKTAFLPLILWDTAREGLSTFQRQRSGDTIALGRRFLENLAKCSNGCAVMGYICLEASMRGLDLCLLYRGEVEWLADLLTSQYQPQDVYCYRAQYALTSQALNLS